jgi:DTW domain-containing protein YfiP
MQVNSEPEFDLGTLDPKERYKALVEFQTKRHVDFMESRNRCRNCVLLKDFCVCRTLDSLRIDNPAYTVAVLMHQKEMYRSSNTVKAIEKVIGADVFVDGLANDNERFNSLIADRKEHTIVLFPSEDSMEWGTYKTTLASSVKSTRTLIVVVDGTWRQARRLNYLIPADIPRVKITPTTLSKFLCRRQAREDRVCTIEALALLFEDIGEPEISSRLDEGLTTIQEGYNSQCYGSTHRPSSMLKGAPNGKVQLQTHPDSLIIESDKHFIRKALD